MNTKKEKQNRSNVLFSVKCGERLILSIHDDVPFESDTAFMIEPSVKELDIPSSSRVSNDQILPAA